jgi:tetratricopeptide (TPR) repeat protein
MMRSFRVVLMAVFVIFVVNAVWGEKQEKPRFHSSTYKTTAKINLKDEYRLYDSAVVILEEGIQFFPEDAEMHFLLGKAYAYKKNYRSMAEHLAAAESLQAGEKKKAKWMEELDQIRNEKWPEIFNQGVNAHNEDRLDESLELFLICNILNPQDYRGFLRAGYAYALKGDNQNAAAYMEKGLQLEPDNPNMMRGYADVLFFSGRGAEALDSYKKILETNPTELDILKNVATIYTSLSDFDQALVHLEKAVEIDPIYKDGFFNIGEIHLQKLVVTLMQLDSLKGETGEYLKDEQSAPKVEQLLQRKKDELNAAQVAYEKVMEIDSADVEAMDRLTKVYQEQENFDLAFSLLKNLVQKDSTNCKAWQQLAFIYAKRNMDNETKEAYQKALDCVKAKE